MRPRKNWSKTRVRIYERDAGVCQVCGRPVPPEWYECGHIVDRCLDGSDEDDNLVVMCIACNRLKDVHATPTDFPEAIRSNDPLAIARGLSLVEAALDVARPAMASAIARAV